MVNMDIFCHATGQNQQFDVRLFPKNQRIDGLNQQEIAKTNLKWMCLSDVQDDNDCWRFFQWMAVEFIPQISY